MPKLYFYYTGQEKMFVKTVTTNLLIFLGAEPVFFNCTTFSHNIRYNLYLQ